MNFDHCASVRPVEHVLQQDPYGCAIACVAMISGQTYEEVRSLLGGDVARRVLGGEDGRGLSHYTVFELLSHLGFACRALWKTNQLNQFPREAWPPQPLSDAHIVIVHLPTGGHAIVWLRDGTVLDPMRSGIFSLGDFPEPMQVIGVVPLGATTMIQPAK